MRTKLLEVGIEAVERGWLPDLVTRAAIRHLCRNRLRDAASPAEGGGQAAFRETLRRGPIAPAPQAANQQHYELPADFFAAILGPRRKYSCCYFPHARTSLAEAEEAALEQTCSHADLADGQTILELGCGWGSLSLWMAKRFPRSDIVAVSNSASQRQFIEAEARRRGVHRLRVVTADINHFSPAPLRFDRIVSVEMFEHLRNFDLLLQRIRRWLNPQGKLFVHIFCHRQQSYPFEVEGAANWMGRHFFTGGIMPSADLLHTFPHWFDVQSAWSWNGQHYRRTAEAWLRNLDARREEVLPILRATYGSREADRWFHRWRIFFLAVAETFGYGDGEEWFVSHYLLQPVEASAADDPVVGARVESASAALSR